MIQVNEVRYVCETKTPKKPNLKEKREYIQKNSMRWKQVVKTDISGVCMKTQTN